MDKLQYDSFYKFLVSTGIVLIVTPLLGVYYFLCNCKDLLIDKINVDLLSEVSLQLLNQREALLSFVLKYIPLFCLVSFTIGLISLVYGGIKWHKIQLELDEQTILKTKEQQATIKALTASEIAEKAINEAISDGNMQTETKDSNIITRNDRILKGLQIQDKCFSYIRHILPDKYYDIQQNVRINSSDFDIIAQAKYKRTDLIYEVKYYTTLSSKGVIRDIVQRIKLRKSEYSESLNRDCEATLLIVVPDELFESYKSSLYSSVLTNEVKIMLLKESNL